MNEHKYFCAFGNNCGWGLKAGGVHQVAKSEFIVDVFSTFLLQPQ